MSSSQRHKKNHMTSGDADGTVGADASMVQNSSASDSAEVRDEPIVQMDWQDGALVGVRIFGTFPSRAEHATKAWRVFIVEHRQDQIILTVDPSATVAKTEFADSGVPVRIALDRSAPADMREASPQNQKTIVRFEWQDGVLNKLRIQGDFGNNLDQPRGATRSMFKILHRSNELVLSRDLPREIITTGAATESFAARPSSTSPIIATRRDPVSPSTLLFVLGPHKTFTSSLVGLLNSCPDIFLLFETEPYLSRPTKWAAEILRQRPDLRGHFLKQDNLERSYHALHESLSADGRGYLYFGDKIATIDDDYLVKFKKLRKLVTVRDLETWLAKGAIRRLYALDGDIVPAACQYVKFLIKSRLTANVLLIRLEDVIRNLDAEVGRISSFLGPDLDIPANWHESVGEYSSSDPKRFQPWWNHHPSSLAEIKSLDVHCQISSHAFWEAILPIFRKYFDGIPAAHLTDEQQDLSALEAIQAHYQVPWQDAFASVTEWAHEQT
jgi:hypothetical protein